LQPSVDFGLGHGLFALCRHNDFSSANGMLAPAG
jgi:hypothetical protein